MALKLAARTLGWHGLQRLHYADRDRASSRLRPSSSDVLDRLDDCNDLMKGRAPRSLSNSGNLSWRSEYHRRPLQ